MLLQLYKEYGTFFGVESKSVVVGFMVCLRGWPLLWALLIGQLYRPLFGIWHVAGM